MTGSNSGAYSDSPIGDDETAANAPGFASIIKRLAGNALRLYEQLTGTGIDGGPATVPPNPQGLRGRDYSGPPYGPAVRHPIASFSGHYNPSNLHSAGAGWQYIEITDVPVTIPLRLWIRGHHQHQGAPYSRGYWSMRARRASAGTSTVTMYQASVQGGVGPFWTCAMDVSGTTNASYDWDADGNRADFYSALAPGVNEMSITLVSDSSTAIYVSSLVLNQVAKRGH